MTTTTVPSLKIFLKSVWISIIISFLWDVFTTKMCFMFVFIVYSTCLSLLGQTFEYAPTPVLKPCLGKTHLPCITTKTLLVLVGNHAQATSSGAN